MIYHVMCDSRKVLMCMHVQFDPLVHKMNKKGEQMSLVFISRFTNLGLNYPQWPLGG